MYHWASRLAQRLRLVHRWFNIAGQLRTLAGIDYGCALFVTAARRVPLTTANVLIVYGAVLLSHAAINHFGIDSSRGSTTSAHRPHRRVIAIVGAVFLFAPKQRSDSLRAHHVERRDGVWWAFVVGLCRSSGRHGYDASASTSERPWFRGAGAVGHREASSCRASSAMCC